MHKCPKQEHRSWTPEDVCEVQCSGCGKAMEFFREEEKRKCRQCGRIVINPKYQKAE